MTIIRRLRRRLTKRQKSDTKKHIELPQQRQLLVKNKKGWRKRSWPGVEKQGGEL
jgi:hypothetical protein